MDFSFVIPALNEEAHIGGVLDSIRASIDERYYYEVIMVDNGSTDQTVKIASQKDATVIHAPHSSISAMRNLGATEAKADIFVFLDADVYLRRDWTERIKTVIERFRHEPNLITGSLCGISDENNWIERAWFAPRTTRTEAKYINSGHLILPRDLFWKIGGFNAQLETGEDYEFCARAREMGVQIENDPELKVMHAGYPKTIKRFFVRERWHARGDFTSISATATSKPALVCTACLVMALACIFGVVLFPKYWCVFPVGYLFFLASVSLVSAIYRCRSVSTSILDIIMSFALFMVYFTARTVSLVDVLIERIADKLQAVKRRKS
jgi:glycosyltransferase involved in cell wall biosynthesis